MKPPAATDQVRSGTDAARVEAVFTDVAADEDDPLADVLAAGEGMAIIRREVGVDGRSVVRVNDRSVTVGGLATLGARLAEIHGQHEQQRLLAADRQLALLDRFGELEGRVAVEGLGREVHLATHLDERGRLLVLREAHGERNRPDRAQVGGDVLATGAVAPGRAAY